MTNKLDDHQNNLEITRASSLVRRLRKIKASLRRLTANWEIFRHHPTGMIGLSFIVLFGLMAVSHPILMRTVWDRARFDPIVGFDLDAAPHPVLPNATHLLGTDGFGRDVLSQLIFGSSTSFGVGILAGIIAVMISTILGGAAGYYGGLLDVIYMGVADVFVLLPAPLIMLIAGLLIRMNWPMIAIMYGILTGLGGQAIVVKSQTLTIKVRPFIDAARISGGSNWHIIFKHILPGLMPLAIVHGVFTVVGAVLTESLLSFFSRSQIHLSWGSMIWIGQQTFRMFTLDGQWHAIAPPAIAIMLFCSAFYLVGRALDEIVNPRLRGR